MSEVITYVGIDAHKRELQVAVLCGTHPVERFSVPNEPRAIHRLRRRLEREAPGRIVCCYEAGACGYALQRQLNQGRIRCQVIAPSLVPRKSGDRVKTDRRDARKLAEMLRAGLLTEVHPPTPEEEAYRDLGRARDDVREDLMRARHRLAKFFLRRGLHYSGRHWTVRHREWIDRLTWEHVTDRPVLEDALLAIDHLEVRLGALDAHLLALAETDRYREPVAWLRCFRGIDTLTAVLLLLELHDFRRFTSPRALMAFVGLVPSEDSSGEEQHRGRITRTGNSLVRRLLVQSAWHYQHRVGTSRALRARREGQPGRIIAVADKAQLRLCRRFQRLRGRHMASPKVVVAIARELIGFIWAALQPVPAV